MSELLNAALAYAARGWHVFPCAPEGKRPITERGYKDATTDPERIRAWWGETPDANIGLNLERTGFVALDADTYKEDCAWSSFAANHDVPPTLTQRSARGGAHFIFQAELGARYRTDIGEAVDTKHKGYILLHPSRFEGGTYHWVNDAPIAPAPEWLKRPERTLAETVGNATGNSGCSLAMAEEALRWINPDMHHDQWVAVLMALHDEFGDEGLTLAEEWSARAPHRYQEGVVETKFASFSPGGGVSIGTVFDMARKAGANLGDIRAKHANTEQWFAPVPEADRGETIFDLAAQADGVGNTDSPPLYPLMRIGELMKREPPTFLIDRIVPQRSMGVFVAGPGAGKTFALLDMGLAIAHGLPDWHGYPINPSGDGSVVYIAAEGSFDLPLRIGAWLTQHGIEDISDRFLVLESAVNFMDPEAVAKLVRSIAALGVHPALIVIDTVSRALPGADENAQKDMTLFIAACERVQVHFRCTVLGAHHTSKAGGIRGSTVLEGACDFVVLMDREKGATHGTLTMYKQKAEQDGWSRTFMLVERDVGPQYLPAAFLAKKPVWGSLVFDMPEEPASDAVETVGPDLSALILAEIEKAWVSGNPWSLAPQAKNRYAVRHIVVMFNIKGDAAERMLKTWIEAGVVEVRVANSDTKVKGLYVRRYGTEDDEAGGIFG